MVERKSVKKQYYARHADIDGNGHVNNSYFC
ncbi:MAG: hypothetical protein LBL38_01885 [Lactobacillales bacterium]|nr:hypothetical protein [Lactobacillales bacterium]